MRLGKSIYTIGTYGIGLSSSMSLVSCADCNIQDHSSFQGKYTNTRMNARSSSHIVAKSLLLEV